MPELLAALVIERLEDAMACMDPARAVKSAAACSSRRKSRATASRAAGKSAMP